jgi:hypothetical protein
MKVICVLCKKITEVFINIFIDGIMYAVCKNCIEGQNKIKEVESEEEETQED